MIHVSLKTEEDPVTAVNRARGVFQDIAAENRGSMHAVMSTRPGCTIVSVDMVIDGSEESSDIHVGAPSESDGPESARRSLTDAVEKFVSRLAQNGSRRGSPRHALLSRLQPSNRRDADATHHLSSGGPRCSPCWASGGRYNAGDP